MTNETKFDTAIETARSQEGTALLALSEAAQCADQAELDGGLDEEEDWYKFAVGVAAHDSRCCHLFAS